MEKGRDSRQALADSGAQAPAKGKADRQQGQTKSDLNKSQTITSLLTHPVASNRALWEYAQEE